MRPRSLPARVACAAFVMALFLKAFVPMLASIAAEQQGVATGAICSVYGVVLPTERAADADVHASHAHADAPDEVEASAHHGNSTHRDSTSHGGDHCPLSALTAFGGGSVSGGLDWKAARRLVRADAAAASLARRDAAARWAASIAHAPPALRLT